MSACSPAAVLAAAVIMAALCGACCGSNVAADYVNTWVNEGAVGADKPPALSKAAAVRYGSDVVMFGGKKSDDATTSLMYKFVTATQEWQLEVYSGAGATPAPRYGHAMVASVSSPHLLYVFSGCSSAACTPATSSADMLPFSNVYMQYNLVTKKWTSLSATGTIVDPRFGALVLPWVDSRSPDTLDSEYFVIYGGYTPATAKNDKVYLFQVSSGQFTELPILPSPSNPPPLAEPAGIVVDDVLYVFGGHAYTGTASYSNTVYALDLQTNTWSIVATANTPSPRAGAAFGTVDGTSLLIHGGYTGTTLLGETAVLNVTAPTKTWFSLASGAGRGGTASAVAMHNLFVFGGHTGTVRPGTLSGDGLTYFTRPQVLSSSPNSGKTCAQKTVTVVGREFRPGAVCAFAGVTTPATYVSATSVTCPAAIPVVENSVSSVEVSVGNVAHLLAAPRAAVSYLYAEDVSSPATTRAIGLPTAGEAGTVVPFQIQTSASCGIERLTRFLDPPLTGNNDNVTLVVTDVNNAAVMYSVPVAFDADPTTFGRYTAALNTTVASVYRLHIILNDVPVADVPELTIAPALPEAEAADTFITPPAATTSVAGTPIVFYFAAVDAFGNDVTNPELFTAVAVVNPRVSLTGVIGSGPGTLLKVTFPTTTTAGAYAITVRTGHDAGLVGSYTHTVEPAAFDVASSTAFGETSIGKVAERNVIYIQPRDRFGNARVESGVDFTMTLVGSSSISGTVSENTATGLYEAEYTATRVGQYAIDIQVGSTAIVDSPFSVTIKVGSVQSIRDTRAFGAGVQSVVAGKKGFFLVQARDPYNNLVPFGGLNLTVTSAAISDASVLDHGDGSYSVSYTAKHLGHFGDQKLCVTQGGDHIRGSPFDLKVEFGVAHRRYRYKMLMRNPDKVFPTVEDDHDENDPWVVDPDWAEGGVPLDDIGLDMDPDAGFGVNDLVSDFHDTPAIAAPPSSAASADNHHDATGIPMANLSRT
ncbi:D-protein [Thecamonas trahens ATCC 50062]|uniref:D-protein n=1 Tax=Thecamonas trahens ATCC 50062 TaxID=461836 RepID=A0A0L0D6K3_THETB|nr:D-protein [Thecamonas trahens ATCC 50062]KNC47830.1 D-protein [Thecamonas trahens ATCC 50062]|eukprot:XP_013759308.1 D-protein [Thecamonas trahens ATCC 50062]